MFHQAGGLCLGVGSGWAAEFDQQPASTLGQDRQPFRIDALAARVMNEQIVQTLQSDRAILR